jgi:hypothetical protein
LSLGNEKQQQPYTKEVPIAVGLRRSQRIRKPTISYDYEVYVNDEIQMEGDHISFEEAMRWWGP